MATNENIIELLYEGFEDNQKGHRWIMYIAGLTAVLVTIGLIISGLWVSSAVNELESATRRVETLVASQRPDLVTYEPEIVTVIDNTTETFTVEDLTICFPEGTTDATILFTKRLRFIGEPPSWAQRNIYTERGSSSFGRGQETGQDDGATPLDSDGCARLGEITIEYPQSFIRDLQAAGPDHDTNYNFIVEWLNTPFDNTFGFERQGADVPLRTTIQSGAQVEG